jgi:hypothetical protein
LGERERAGHGIYTSFKGVILWGEQLFYIEFGSQFILPFGSYNFNFYHLIGEQPIDYVSNSYVDILE